jgi:hypothetical protein
MFIATRCPISLDYDERMASLAKEYMPKGVMFIGINANNTEPASEVTEHAQKKGFTFPVLKDEGNRVADLYDAKVTPEVFVLDSNFVLALSRAHRRQPEPAACQPARAQERAGRDSGGQAAARATDACVWLHHQARAEVIPLTPSPSPTAWERGVMHAPTPAPSRAPRLQAG